MASLCRWGRLGAPPAPEGQRPRDRGREQPVGIGGLGGVEYLVNRRNALKFEGRAQFVDDVFGVDPGGFAATVGFKHYF